MDWTQGLVCKVCLKNNKEKNKSHEPCKSETQDVLHLHGGKAEWR